MADHSGGRWSQPANVSVAATERTVRSDGGWVWSNAALSSRDVLPADPSTRVRSTRPGWFTEVVQRVTDLALRPAGWDSYGGRPLREEAVRSLSQVLNEFEGFIQRAPTVSLTDDGGVACEWESPEAEVEIRIEPEGPVEVYYMDPISRREWEGPVTDCRSLDKLLWQASSPA